MVDIYLDNSSFLTICLYEVIFSKSASYIFLNFIMTTYKLS